MYEFVLNEKNRNINRVEYDPIHNIFGVPAMIINIERKLSNKILDIIIFYKHSHLKINAYAVVGIQL